MKIVCIALLLVWSSRVTSQPNESFKIQQTVSLIGQDNPNACWAASSAMMLSWKKQQSISISSALTTLDGGNNGVFRTTYNNSAALPLAQVNALVQKVGLKAEAPANYSIDFYKDRLKKGPLLILYQASAGIAHAVVLYGIEGDGTPKNTFLLINDPWPNTGQPSKTNNKGQRLRLNMFQFSSFYENFVRNFSSSNNLIAQVYRF